MAERVAGFVDAAEQTLELALYDVRLPGAAGDRVRAAIEGAAKRGVAVRLAYNLERDPGERVPVPPPPSTQPDLIEGLTVPTLGHPRDEGPDAPQVRGARRARRLDGLDELDEGRLDSPGERDRDGGRPARGRHLPRELRGALDRRARSRRAATSARSRSTSAGTSVRAWFTPGNGADLSHRIAEAIGRAERRVRIASPVITAGPVIGTLAQEVAEGRLDLAGVVDMPAVLRRCSRSGGRTRARPGRSRC